MPRTSDELVNDVCERVGAGQDGNPPNPEDAAKVRRVLPGVAQDLRARDIFWFANLDAIPDEAFEHFADIVAGVVSLKFGLSGQELAEVQGARQAAEQKLRHIRAMPYSGAPARPLYF